MATPNSFQRQTSVGNANMGASMNSVFASSASNAAAAGSTGLQPVQMGAAGSAPQSIAATPSNQFGGHNNNQPPPPGIMPNQSQQHFTQNSQDFPGGTQGGAGGSYPPPDLSGYPPQQPPQMVQVNGPNGPQWVPQQQQGGGQPQQYGGGGYPGQQPGGGYPGQQPGGGYPTGGGYPQQQQQQVQWVQVMTPSGPQWVQQPMGMPGMCGNDPNSVFASCCPQNPYTPICINDPDDQMAACSGFMGICDSTTWIVFFFVFMTIIGFGVAVGTEKVDDLFGVYGVTNTAALELAVFKDLTITQSYIGIVESSDRCTQICEVRNGTKEEIEPTYPGWTLPATTTVEPTLSKQVQPKKNQCPFAAGQDKLTGLIGGQICDYHSMSATTMVINLSRWNNFRGTLYFIAMMGTLCTFLIIYIVHKHRLGVHYPPPAIPPQSPPSINQIKFHGTPLYYMFRFAWGVTSVIIFLWVCTEMYQYWWFENMYLGLTVGRLQSFWRGYDKKFVGTVVPITIYLCWPIIQVMASIGWWIGMVGPWVCFKNMCYPVLGTYTKDPNVLEDQEGCCIASDNFFTQFRQMQRLGFSQGMWFMMTETREPFTTCLDQIGAQQAPPLPGGAMHPQAPGAMGHPGMQAQQMQQQQQPGFAGSAAPSPSHGGVPPGLSHSRQHSMSLNNNANIAGTSSRGEWGEQVGGVELSREFSATTGSKGDKPRKHRSGKEGKEGKEGKHKSHKSSRSKRDGSSTGGGGTSSNFDAVGGASSMNTMF